MGQSGSDASKHLPRGHRWFLLATCFLLYAATASGDLIGDTEVRWLAARRLVETGWFDVPRGATELSAPGIDGREYVLYAPGQWVCLTPFVVAGKLFAALPGAGTLPADRVGQFLASLVMFPLFGSLAVLLLFNIAWDLTGNVRASSVAALLFGVGTMHWQHTINTSEESQVAACSLATLWLAWRALRSDNWRDPLLAAAAAGAGMLFRPSSLAVTAPVLAVLATADIVSVTDLARLRRRLAVWATAAGVGLTPFLVIAGVYNAVRFGDAFTSGYGDAYGTWVLDAAGRRILRAERFDLFATPFLEGLGGLLISPGKGVLVYNPILLVALPGLTLLWKTQRALTVAIAVALCTTVALHSKLTWWSGDRTWGSRYLASSLGLLMIGIVPLLERAAWRRGVVAIAALSVAFQAASVVYNHRLEFLQNTHHGSIPDAYVWRPAESHLWWRLCNIGAAMAGRPIKIPPAAEGADPPDERAIRQHRVVNVFPFKARGYLRGRAVTLGLVGLWLVLVAGLTLAAWRWWRSSSLDRRAVSPD